MSLFFRAGTVPFPSVRVNDDTIIDLFPKEMLQKTAQAGPGRENLNHFCIALSKSDWDALGERLKGKGVAIKYGRCCPYFLSRLFAKADN